MHVFSRVALMPSDEPETRLFSTPLHTERCCCGTDGILLNPYQTVDEAQLWRLPPCSQTSGMLMNDAVSGSWQIGVGAPLYWFGLDKFDQDPCALEPHEKALIKQQLSQRLSLGDSASSEQLSSS